MNFIFVLSRKFSEHPKAPKQNLPVFSFSNWSFSQFFTCRASRKISNWNENHFHDLFCFEVYFDIFKIIYINQERLSRKFESQVSNKVQIYKIRHSKNYLRRLVGKCSRGNERVWSGGSKKIFFSSDHFLPSTSLWLSHVMLPTYTCVVCCVCSITIAV